jgi:hypothetical protein
MFYFIFLTHSAFRLWPKLPNKPTLHTTWEAGIRQARSVAASRTPSAEHLVTISQPFSKRHTSKKKEKKKGDELTTTARTLAPANMSV